ncbi:MAG: hypothetical protein Q8L88_03445 [Bacteroidota bacterium]|nr:hypothetical protein [Bacteroidota bacterium]
MNYQSLKIFALFILLTLESSGNDRNDCIDSSVTHCSNLGNNLQINLIDSTNYFNVELAKYYEKNELYDKALNEYTELLKNGKNHERVVALEGIKRVEDNKNNLFYKFKIFCIDYSQPIAFVFILFILFIIIIKFTYLIIKKVNKKISINIMPFSSSNLAQDLFFIFKIYIEWNLSQLKNFGELKKRVSYNELESPKPVMRSKTVNELFEITSQIIDSRVGAINKTIYNFLFPSDYIICGNIDVVNEKRRKIFVTVNHKGNILKMWEKSVPTNYLNDELNSLTYQVLVFIEEQN